MKPSIYVSLFSLLSSALIGCNVVLDLPPAFSETAGAAGESNGGASSKGGSKGKGGASSGGSSSTKNSSKPTGGANSTGGTSSTDTSSTGGIPSTGGTTTVGSPEISSFTVDYNKVCSGNTATLKAVFSNGTGTVSGGVGTITSGVDKVTGAITANTTYTLTVTNSKGEKVESTVTVTALKSGDFTPTGAPATEVYGYTGELLPNGNVLYRGADCKLQQYDLRSGTFSLVGTSAPCPAADTMTSLGNGTVLLAGWEFVNAVPQAKIFIPANGQFTSTAMMSSYHAGAKSVYLPATGRVLVIGGEDGSALRSYDTVEAFNPTQGENGAFASLKMQIPRSEHTVTLLADGKVLVTGGVEYNNGSDTKHSSAEIYDPSTGTNGAFTLTGSMAIARSNHAAALLHDGNVLIVGGDTTEVFNTSSGKFTSVTGSPTVPRAYNHSLVTLKTGRVLVFGGFDKSGTWTNISEIYNSTTEKFAVLPTTAKTRGRPVMLPNGVVLIAGPDSNKAPSAELFCP